jgi:hypothetical protein
MRRGLRKLVLTSTVIVAITAVLVILALLFGPGGEWVGPPTYWMWGRTRFENPWSLLASVAIALLMLAIPLGHIAWLIMAALWLSRSAGPPRARAPSSCPHCNTEVQPDWKACPYCGESLAARRTDIRAGDEEQADNKHPADNRYPGGDLNQEATG